MDRHQQQQQQQQQQEALVEEADIIIDDNEVAVVANHHHHHQRQGAADGGRMNIEEAQEEEEEEEEEEGDTANDENVMEDQQQQHDMNVLDGAVRAVFRNLLLKREEKLRRRKRRRRRDSDEEEGGEEEEVERERQKQQEVSIYISHEQLNSIQGTCELQFLQKCREFGTEVDRVTIGLFLLPRQEEEAPDEEQQQQPDNNNENDDNNVNFAVEEHRRFRRFVGRCIGSFTSLRSLSIAGNDILGAAIVLENVPPNYLTKLHFNYNPITEHEHSDPASVSAMMYSLEHALKGLTNLKELEVNGLYNIFFSAIPRMRHLSSLALYNYRRHPASGAGPDGAGGGVSLRSIYRCLHGLDQLMFYYCTLNSTDTCALADALSYNPRLKILKQAHCRIDVESSTLLSQILVTNTTLIELRLDCLADSRFYGALVLAMRMNSSLKTLILCPVDIQTGASTDDIHSAGLRDLLLVSLRCNTSLEHIQLWNFFFGDFLLGALHSYLIATAATTATASLRKLDILCPAMPAINRYYWDSRMIHRIFDSVSQNKSLMHFHFVCYTTANCREIGDAVMSLQNNRTLEELYIDPRRRGPLKGDASLFVECVRNLTKNRRVRRIEVGDKELIGTTLSAEQWDTILNVLRQNYTIRCCNQIDDRIFLYDVNGDDDEDTSTRRIKEARKLVATYLKLNKLGRAYLLDSNPSKERGVSLLESVSDDLDALYVSLLENPLLCVRTSPLSPGKGSRQTAETNTSTNGTNDLQQHHQESSSTTAAAGITGKIRRSSHDDDADDDYSISQTSSSIPSSTKRRRRI